MNLAPLTSLPASVLQDLAHAVASGRLRPDSPRAVVASIIGSQAGEVHPVLVELAAAGFDAARLEILVRAVLTARSDRESERNIIDLVLSGPDVAGIPTADTEAVVQSLFQEAAQEVLIVGYAFHDGRRLFGRLAERMQAQPDLEVIFHLDVARKASDTSLDSEILWRFAQDFRQRHWPWDPAPKIFYDPRALSLEPRQRASLHAKCVIVDRRTALVTSANFTTAAQQRNIEVGILTRSASLAAQVAAYFAALRDNGALRPIPVGPRPD